MSAGSSISIALCTYNGERFLREQLESIAAQTLPAIELVVSDDASSDATASIIEAFARNSPIPLRLHCNEDNFGVAGNFDRAIGYCSGDLIALADQDDVWLPHKLARLHDALVTNPEASYAFSDARLIDADGHDTGGKSLLARRFTLRSIAGAFATGRELDLMLKRDFIYGTTLMVRAAERARFLPIPSIWSHDTWIVNKLALQGRPGVAVLESLVKYRQHALQASGGTATPRNVANVDRVRAYEALRGSLGGAAEVRADALTRIDDKLRYLRAMVRMDQAAGPRRLAIAAGEVAAGRWRRYSPRTFIVDKRLRRRSLGL